MKASSSATSIDDQRAILQTSIPTPFALPKANVRRIMKLNDQVCNISAESVAATTKAAELFLLHFADAAAQIAAQNNRKTVKVDDLLLVIKSNQHKYEFLNTAFGR
eukprot:gene25039-33551_t